MSLSLPRFRRDIPLVEANGNPTQTFHQWWDTVAKNLETAFNSLEQTVIDIQTALDTANAAAREAARINSYPNPGSIVSAIDAGTTASITIANHTRVYPVQGIVDVPDVTITGSTLTGLAFSTRYYIYYDDPLFYNHPGNVYTPTFLSTITSATSQVGAAPNRHFVGYIDTPADGGSGTSGNGGGPPGGGGGGGGGYIP